MKMAPPKRLAARAHLRLICRLVALVWRAAPRLFCLTLAINLILGLLPVGRIYATASILALLADLPHGAAGNALVLHQLWVLTAFLAILAVFGSILGQVNNTVGGLFQTRVTNFMQGLVLEKAASLDLAFFEHPEFHDKLTNASSEAGTRPLAIVQQLMNIGSSATNLISLGGVVACWHVWLLPIVLLPPAALIWMNSNLSALSVEMKLQNTELARRGAYFNSVLKSPRAAKEIRLFGLATFFLSKLQQILDELTAQQWGLARRRLFSRGAFVGAMSLNQPLIIGYAAWQFIGGRITFRGFSLYSQAVFSLQSRLNGLAASIGGIYENDLFAASVFEFLELQPQVETPRARSSACTISRRPKIEFRSVGFRYPGSELWVLQNVSFKIDPGERVALVGENGAGKSTIVKLLGGLYEPDLGEILLDGVNLKEFGRTELRRHFAMIFQDFVLYDISARENVGVGDLNKLGDLHKIQQAAQSSGLHAVIEKLPHGYETLLARAFKRGHELSGGQRQMVAIARMLLRDAPILVLDEPTAALDVNHERHLLRTLLAGQPASSRSILLVCHRLTAVRHAERIIVLGGGRIVEQGSHEELMTIKGPYHELFNLQLDMYGRSWLNESAGDKSDLVRR